MKYFVALFRYLAVFQAVEFAITPALTLSSSLHCPPGPYIKWLVIMDKFVNDLYVRMQESLQEAAFQSENALQRAERSLQTAEAALRSLRRFVEEYSFRDQKEEIRYFKEIKPRFLRELIYHREIFYAEAGKPVADKDSELRYFRQCIERLKPFFERNQILYMYYRMGKSDYDHLLFVREAAGTLILPEYDSTDMDLRFSTPASYKLSKIQAYEMFKEYLEAGIYRIENGTSPDATVQKPENSWTDSKAALIELAYALYSRGSIDHGKATIKQIINSLGMIFNVDVGNHYRAFQSMRIRKKNRTTYLDALKESLERKMDETDLQF